MSEPLIPGRGRRRRARSTILAPPTSTGKKRKPLPSRLPVSGVDPPKLDAYERRRLKARGIDPT